MAERVSSKKIITKAALCELRQQLASTECYNENIYVQQVFINTC